MQNGFGKNVQVIRPARMSDFMVGEDYRYLDVPPGLGHAYQEKIPVVPKTSRKRLDIAIPKTAPAFKAELESHTDSEITKRPRTSMRLRPTMHIKKLYSEDSTASVDNPDIVGQIKQRSLFHGGGPKKHQSIYGSLRNHY